MIKCAAILLIALLLQGPVASFSHQERNESMQFSFPESASPGTVYRVADHTDFEWDTMGILYWHKDYMEPSGENLYTKIEAFDPAFFSTGNVQDMALVFYLNGEVVYASHGGDSRIMINNPLHSYLRPYLELSVEEAVFVFVGSPWPEWVPHHLLEKFRMLSFPLPQEKSEDTHFSFPESASPGTAYRVADHTDFEWDKMKVFDLHFVQMIPANVYEEVEAFDPSFFDASDAQGTALVFYLNGKIVHASHGGEGRTQINPPIRSLILPFMGFSAEDALFVFVEGMWPGWVPYGLQDWFSITYQEKSESTHFSFPESASPGTMYRVADHTDFDWDKLMILYSNWSVHPLQADAPSIYKEMEAFDPAFFSASGREGMALVFYQNEEIVHVGESGKSRIEIDNPLHSRLYFDREFSVEGAVFVFMDGEWPAWVPYDFVENFLALFPQLYFLPDP